MMLPVIDVDSLKPSPDSLTQLKADILDDAHVEEWLPAKVRSLECGDGLAIKELMD